MYRASRRTSLFARILILALLIPLIVACGNTTTPTTSPSPAVTEPSPPVTEPEVSPSPAEPVASPSPDATDASPSPDTTEASPSPDATDASPSPDTTEASPSPSPDTAEASPDASPVAGTREPAESPINDKILIFGTEQAPDTLWGFETISLATTELLNATGLCITTLTYEYQPTYCFDDFPTLENGGAVTETVTVDPASISEETPIIVDGEIITDTALAEEAGIEIPEELPQMTLTWELNPELTWEDGTPVTSADYVEAFRVQKDPATNLIVRRVIDSTESVEAVDDHTVEQRMVPGYFNTIYFVETWLGFVPAHLYEGASIEEIRDQESVDPLSFGPYVVESYNPGAEVTLVSNPYFPDQPNIGTIVFKFVADANQLLAQLQTGEIDVPSAAAMNISMVPDLDDMEAAGDITTQYVPATFWEHMDFGIERGDGAESFFEDVRVRQAFAYAINRQEIVDEVQLGRAAVMNTIVPEDHPAHPGNDALEAYEYDPERAQELLDEAGATDSDGDGTRELDGRPMEMTFYTTQGRPDRQAVAEIIQQNLAEVGVTVNLEFVPGPEQLFLTGSEGILSGRRFDLAMYAYLSGVDPGLDLYLCSAIPTPENSYAGQNNPGYCNPEYDQVANRAMAATSLDELNELAGEPLTIINQDLPTLPIYQRSKIGAFAANVSGIEVDPTENTITYNIQEWDIEEE